MVILKGGSVLLLAWKQETGSNLWQQFMRAATLSLTILFFETLPMEEPGFFFNADTTNVLCVSISNKRDPDH